jgi:hypothetical protein
MLRRSLPNRIALDAFFLVVAGNLDALWFGLRTKPASLPLVADSVPALQWHPWSCRWRQIGLG